MRPAAVAFLGVGAYRTAFGRPRAVVGLQPERLEGADVWVLPNPSGRTAYYLLPALVRHAQRPEEGGVAPVLYVGVPEEAAGASGDRAQSFRSLPTLPDRSLRLL